MGIGIEKGMASADEVQASQNPLKGSRKADRPDSAPGAQKEASEKQIRYLRALGYSGPAPASAMEANQLIDALKEKRQELGEEPF
jgi:hypothetical protein